MSTDTSSPTPAPVPAPAAAGPAVAVVPVPQAPLAPDAAQAAAPVAPEASSPAVGAAGAAPAPAVPPQAAAGSPPADAPHLAGMALPAPLAAALAGLHLPQHPRLPSWMTGATLGLGALALVSLGMAWSTQQRLIELERAQAQRLDSMSSVKAQATAAQDQAKDTSTKLGLLDARVSEALMQRGQVEELIQSMARSRDENVIADVDAALRVAQQQSAITGSAEPLINALRQADERLARYNQPRLERVRRAVVRDLDKARASSAFDIPALAIKLDEAVRMVDELPLMAAPERRSARVVAAPPVAKHAAVAASAASEAASEAGLAEVWARWQTRWADWSQQLWDDVRALVRVSRIERPEAMLINPEQSFFLRENLKLRMVNARLALLSRQFDLAQSDLQQAQDTLNRYFDRSSRRVSVVAEQMNQVATQCRTVNVPRADEALAALAAAATGR